MVKGSSARDQTDIPSANSTLNHFLGNLQKPWMTGRSTPGIQHTPPTPRPTRFIHQPHPTYPPQRATTARIPPDTATVSPLPPCSIIQEHTSHGQEKHMLPSPAPSDEDQLGFSAEDISIHPTTLASKRAMAPPRPNSLHLDKSLIGELMDYHQVVSKISEIMTEEQALGESFNLLECSRLQCLLSACREADYLYLFLHQTLYMWSLNIDLPDQSRYSKPMESGLHRFMTLIGLTTRQEAATARNAQLYAGFPFKLITLRHHNAELFQTYKTEAILLLETLGQMLPRFAQSFEEMETIPLVSDIANSLNVGSPTLQRIIFLSIIRRQWFVQPQTSQILYSELLELFQDNQQNRRSEDSVREQAQRILADHVKLNRPRPILTHAQAQAVPEIEAHGRTAGGQRVSYGANPQALDQTQLQDQYQCQLRQYQAQLQAQFQSGSRHIGGPTAYQNSSRLNPAIPQRLAPVSRQSPQGPITQYYHQPSSYSGPMVLTAVEAHPEVANLNQALVPSTSTLQTTQQLNLNHVRNATLAIPSASQKSIGIIPPPDARVPYPRSPDADGMAYHEMHLRSPIIKPKKSTWDHIEPMFRQVTGFIMSPVHITSSSIQRFSFSIPDDLMLPEDEDTSEMLPRVRVVMKNTKFLRLRCVKWLKEDSPSTSSSEWLSTATQWPGLGTWKLNGRYLEPRRKFQNGRDLPIDITSLVCKGVNELQLSLIRTACTTPDFAIAIEIVSIVSLQDIHTHCNTAGFIAPEASLNGIKRKLTHSNDDELAIIDATATISLRDPWKRGQMWDIPVRGWSCLHTDCFDLNTLLSIPGKRISEHNTGTVDDWKCPSCGGDVRPSSLVQDGFLLEVRKQLEQQGLLHTEAIVVDASGSWIPKPEKIVDNEKSWVGKDKPMTKSPLPALVSAVSAVPPPQPVIIDLLDD